MAHDCETLFSVYPEVISQLGTRFSSHEFIRKLAQQHQAEYIEALHEYRRNGRQGTPALFMVVHGRLAVLLHPFDVRELELGKLGARESRGADGDGALDGLSHPEDGHIAPPLLDELDVSRRQPPLAAGTLRSGLHVEARGGGSRAHGPAPAPQEAVKET